MMDDESAWVPAELPSAPHPNCPMNFTEDKDTWAAVYANKGDLPEFTGDMVLRGMGVLMRRLDHTEAERRKDRARIEELVKENNRMRDKLQTVNDFLTEGSRTALFCESAPAWRDLELMAPRDMSVPELQWLQEKCDSLKKGDLRLPACARILGIVPDAQGMIHIDLVKATALQRWHLYYHIAHKKVHKNFAPTSRVQQQQAAIDAAPAAHSSTMEHLHQGWDEEWGSGEGARRMVDEGGGHLS